MDVTKTNIQEVLPRVKEAISKCTFIAIDCELSGLRMGSTANINAFDTQAEYYKKMQSAAKDFLVIQYGLCIFRYDPDQKVFNQQGYNFYVFPRPTNRSTPDHRFLCQASSIDFLISQGFDFNKLFKDGIPYLNSTEEDKYKKELLEKQKVRLNQIQNSSTINNDKSNGGIAMTDDDRTKVDEIFVQIEQFIASEQEEFILPRCNAFIRRLVYGEAVSRLANRACLETRMLDNKDRVLVVTRVKSKDVLLEEHRKKVQEEEEELKACVGFAEVIKCIVASGKLVIGHNMLLDILHTIQKFLTPLPNDYSEFKDIAHSLFSNVIDTKYMSSNAPFNTLIDSSVLPHVLKAVRKEPFVLPTVEVEKGTQGYGLEFEKAHEAGYDAFITGICFLGMWMHLGKEHYEDAYNVFTNPSSLYSYKNRLFLMRVQDISCMHLGEPDVVPERKHVFYLTFPKDWNTNDIMKLFSPFGNISIGWIDDRSAYIGLQSHEKVPIALCTLSQSDRYTIMTYAERQTQLEAQSALKQQSEGMKLCSKQRSVSLGSNAPKKRSIDSIKEDSAKVVPSCPSKVDSSGNSWNNKTSKKIKKSFNEDSDWS